MQRSTCPLIVYHRGGGKSLGYPPNSMVTLKWAIKHGARAIEFDVVFADTADTDDGGDIVMVEPRLLFDRALDIDSLALKDLKHINTGNERVGSYPVATLQAVQELLRFYDVSQQIHVKGTHPRTPDVLLNKIQTGSGVVLTCFDLEMLRAIRVRDTHCRLGWLVKPQLTEGGEGRVDFTKEVANSDGSLSGYTDHELAEIVTKAQQHSVNLIILCGPRIQVPEVIHYVRTADFEVGAWGVGMNLSLARKLLDIGIDRFTIDNPEQL